MVWGDKRILLHDIAIPTYYSRVCIISEFNNKRKKDRLVEGEELYYTYCKQEEKIIFIQSTYEKLTLRR